MTKQSSRSASKRSKISSLLTPDENELIFGLLSPKCQSLCTGVVQLYMSEPPRYTAWAKKDTGVICFVKDNPKRSYYFRFFCPKTKQLLWEQELYDDIEIFMATPYLITFECQVGVCALNFASEDEAVLFESTINFTILNRQKRREKLVGRNKNHDAEKAVTLRRLEVSNNTLKLQNENTQSPIYGKKDKKKLRIKKEDIGGPSGFVHITHVGWNPEQGFDLNGEDDTLKPFLQKAGVSESQLTDRRTRAFIHDFISSNNVLNTVKSEQSKPLCPPTINSTIGQAPPLPSRKPPARPSTIKKPTMPEKEPVNIPPRPKMPSEPSTLLVPQPPPPPSPMLQQNTDASALTKSSLENNAKLQAPDPRADLLASIRNRTTLKKVETRFQEKINTSVMGDTDVLAKALRKALMDRGKAIHSSDDEESDTEPDNEDDWMD